ncbi:hypothetical protein ACNFJ7_02610 [Sphingomonas sp. HT-1]|uniref:hypothetical protein n=1 Tax=unclassified Sphingomonas TaxID=196159 RepID=UPI00037D2EB0|nr:MULTISPECIES: hypothetical protein [unclassified Sphingomonas]KTF69026.1 hypothetical protein ATB93_11235 [Sphingomonas sp. WG]
MTRRIASAAAMAAMLLAGVPHASGAAGLVLTQRFCMPTGRSMPLPGRKPDRDCIDACHAFCSRSSRAESDDDNCD